MINNVSVWWHVAGAALIVLILIVVPDHHQSIGWVFTERINNSGYAGGATKASCFWFLVVPFGFLLTQYTITGFDASAHLSEETDAASKAAAKGIWRSIFYSAHRRLDPAALRRVRRFRTTRTGNRTTPAWARRRGAHLLEALGKNWATLVLFISASAQFFCATSCMTSASRMTFAFSRDGAIPGSAIWSKVTANRVPANAVMLVAVVRA